MTGAPAEPAWTLVENAPLRSLNTFHVAATAPWLLTVADP
ncbi:MAG TPA: UDP-N-acetylenolpyruvoylglucosamine reductase, partial [Xanthomonadaceae bacterium]|nr:UDP-N-acetylenolpyruvoylglucosamine reductase [Xanthomonadaceae bacterium]